MPSMHDAWKFFTATCILHGSSGARENFGERDHAQMFRGVHLIDTMMTRREGRGRRRRKLFSKPGDFRLSAQRPGIKFAAMLNAPTKKVALPARRAGNHA